MATQGPISTLKKTADLFKSIQRDKLLRPTLGDLSLKSAFESKLDEITKKANQAAEFAPSVSDSHVNSVNSILTQIMAYITAQSNLENEAYANQRQTFLNNINAQLESLQQYWTHFIAAGLEARGFLEDEGIKKEFQRAIDAMKEESKVAVKQLKEESTKVLEEAKKLAQQIEEKARKTAAKISVEEAQKQFEEAQKQCKKQVVIWVILSAVSIVAFVGLTVYLAFYYSLPKLSSDGGWHEIIYYTAIRIVFLGAIGSVASFCLSILRAYLHMMQHNLHRQRVANSMAAFIESAVTPEQRDMILAQLVDAIVSFGSSGLLPKKADALYTPKMSIDTISRSFTPPTTK